MAAEKKRAFPRITRKRNRKKDKMYVTDFNPTDGINANSHRREKQFIETFQLLRRGERSTYNLAGIKTVAELRIYGSSTGATNTACLWVNCSDRGIHCNGSGVAGGYGYHRPSAAAYRAFETAGIKFNKGIAGVGDSAIKSALMALGASLGYKNCTILKGHA